VLVKLSLTAVTLALMLLAGRTLLPVGIDVPAFSFAIALIITTVSILSLGFLIASIVPRRASRSPSAPSSCIRCSSCPGCSIPAQLLPAWLQHLPLSYAVIAAAGHLEGRAWSMHMGDVAGLAAVFVICTRYRRECSAGSETVARGSTSCAISDARQRAADPSRAPRPPARRHPVAHETELRPQPRIR
jgi:hypothetical protein